MGKFSKTVFDCFDGLNFRPSKATASDDFAVLTRRERPGVCSYIYVRDDRRGKGSIAVHYWVAPPDFPDDGLDNLGVGFKIPIGSTYDADADSFIQVARSRVDMLLPAIPSLVEVVERELETPAVVTKRLIAYREQVVLFSTVLALVPVNESVADVVDRANDAVLRNRPYKEFATECQRLIQILKANREQFPADRQQFLDKSDLMLQTIISRQLYIESLVPFAG